MSRVWPWIPAILWAIVITSFSTDTFSEEHTSRVAVPLLRWLFPHASPETIELLHFAVRKCAHIFEYFVFGWLLFRGIRGNRHGWTPQWAASALMLAAIFAAGDEFHQSFVPSRSASPWDALLDITAAAGAIVFVRLWSRGERTAGHGADGAVAP